MKRIKTSPGSHYNFIQFKPPKIFLNILFLWFNQERFADYLN
jgi:hypothetical protein